MAEDRGIDCNRIGGSAQELMEGYIAGDFEASVDVCHGLTEYTAPGPKPHKARSASEVGKFFPRLRFGLVWDVSNLTGSGI